MRLRRSSLIARTGAGNPGRLGLVQIHLVADRVTSLHTGSTHKVYRGWRFAVAMRQGQPQPGAILFAVPVDSALPAKGQTRYAMVQLANQGAIDVGEAAAFSWSVRINRDDRSLCGGAGAGAPRTGCRRLEAGLDHPDALWED